jgi:ABC-type transport system substrate-binding protein
MKADALRQAVARITASDSIIRDIFLQPMLPMPGIVPLWSPFCDRQIPVLRYDPAKAKDMLDQAGYRLDPKTKMRIDPNTGKPLRELKILTDTSATRSQIGKKLTDACRAIGLPAKYESDDSHSGYAAFTKRRTRDENPKTAFPRVDHASCTHVLRNDDGSINIRMGAVGTARGRDHHADHQALGCSRDRVGA